MEVCEVAGGILIAVVGSFVVLPYAHEEVHVTVSRAVCDCVIVAAGTVL